MIQANRPRQAIISRSTLPLARLLTLVFLFAGVVTCPAVTLAQDSKQRAFARVFGDTVKLDPATIVKVKAVKPGEYVLIDRNGDGKHDEAWFIDPSPRHTAAVRPLLVRAIDEDGDLDADGRPDLDSDLYIVDWKADGTVDAVVDYDDTDHDGDVDEMGMYSWSPHDRHMGGDALRVWWARDDGDDNLLWYDVNYAYDQRASQWRSHFSGDEMFVAFGLLEGAAQWEPIGEDPFLFYDPDGDGASEEVMRIAAVGTRVMSLRWSFDADDDTSGRRTHDYDFSITAIAAGQQATSAPAGGGAGLQIPAELMASITLRGIKTGPWLQRQHARKFAAEAGWSRALLCWDEINCNTEHGVERDPHERWEGVIAPGSKDFPQVGGPPCSAFNKRFELVENPKPPLRLYYAPPDARLHLFGAQRGWMDVDFDLDGKIDARYVWLDTDADGYFDRRQLDVDADGQADFTWMIGEAGRRDVPLEFGKISPLWKDELRRTLDESQVMIDAEFSVLSLGAGDPTTAAQQHPITSFACQKLPAWMPQARLGERIRSTPAGMAFYANLTRDLLQKRLWVGYGEHGSAYDLYRFYSAGDYRAAAKLMIKEFVADGPQVNAKAFGSFTKRIPVEIKNAGGPRRGDWPHVLSVAALKGTASDFNADNCAVVAPHRWIDWRQIPHQIDEIDSGTGKELSFSADLEADESATYYIYYSPAGRSPTTFPARTATAEDWIPPCIGWESERIAYRSYWGQFDFFGKKVSRLIYPTIGNRNYHEETDWGMDALSAEKTSGIGGLTIYIGERTYPVQNPQGSGNVKFQKRRLADGPVRAAVEITAANIVPEKPDLTVRMVCLAYAGRQETEVRVRLSGGGGDALLAPGLRKLSRESIISDPQGGCWGTWGFQTPAIGEIGMGLIAPAGALVKVVETPDERRFLLRSSEGTLRYWLIADWRRGREYPVAPTTVNWRNELKALANSLTKDVSVTIGPAEFANETPPATRSE